MSGVRCQYVSVWRVAQLAGNCGERRSARWERLIMYKTLAAPCRVYDDE